MAQDTLIASYSLAFVRKEPDAERIQVFTSSLIPGLLQTEGYARELFRTGSPGIEEDEVNERVTVRMHRKRIFEHEEPPFYWAIMDEAALSRPVGGVACMKEQIHHILRAAKHPRMTIQVLPFAQGAHSMLGGSMTLLTLKTGGTIAMVEIFAFGEQVESPKRLIKLSQAFDVARSKALSENESLDLIRHYLKEYENAHDS
jgi:hypothetical protein